MAVQLNRVFNLTDENFADFVTDHDIVLVAFGFPWVPWMQKFSLVYEQAAAELQKENGIKFACVDLTKEEKLAKQFPIGRVPTLTLLKAGKEVGLYEESWIVSDFVSYARRQLLPVLSPITKTSFPLLKEKEKVLVVGHFIDEDISSKAAFESVANAHHRDFVFGLCTDPSLLQPYGIALYKDFDDRKVVFYKGRMNDEEAIWSFVKSESTPLIVDFRPEVHRGYLKAGLPLGYIFLPSSQASEQRSNLESMIRPLALKYKNKIQFGTIDVQNSEDIVEEMHLDTSPTATWPTFAIREPILDHRYLFDKKGQTSPSEQELSSFVSSFFEGTLKRDIRSEPIPTSQTTAVQNIVGLTFDTLVLESDKDVFVEFYTQTCGPCKAMAPQWEKLAQLFDNDVEGRKRVMIGQIDLEANDVPGDIRGVPWLLLYPAGKKDAPVQYLGKLTVEDMALFVKQQGTFGVDVLKTGQ